MPSIVFHDKTHNIDCCIRMFSVVVVVVVVAEGLRKVRINTHTLHMLLPPHRWP